MYGQSILGIDLALSRRYKEALYEGHELLRMGYTRFNFNYFQTDQEIDYVLSAIEFVCMYGWMFLPNYKFVVMKSARFDEAVGLDVIDLLEDSL